MNYSPHTYLPWALAVLLISATCFSCEKKDSETPSRPNILLVSFDTTRADALGCYGGKARVSPTIDRLASEGILFETVMAPVPLTLPSHATMMSGSLPTRHGVRDNGLFSLDSGAPTLSTLLSESGYATGGFVASVVLDRIFGIAHGFETYADHVQRNTSGEGFVEERRAQEVVDDCLAWADGLDERPYFAFVHFYDPHFPYSPPNSWKKRFNDEPYLEEIAYADSQLERLLGGLKSRGRLDNTIIVVTADHGEALGEHGENTHGYLLYQGTQRVPLIIHHESLEKGKVQKGLVGLCDVMPTLLEFAGLDIPKAVDGVPLLSRLHTLEGEKRKNPGYMESEVPRLAFGFSPLNGMTDGEYTYHNYPRAELYHLESDPSESKNIIADHQDIAEAFRISIESIRNRMPNPAELSPSEDLKSKLESLGYVPGSKDSKVSRADYEIDELLRVIQLRNDGKTFLAAGQHREAIAKFRAMTEIVPDSYMAHELLGSALATVGDFDSAFAPLTKAIELQWALPESHFNLAFYYVTKGDKESAKNHLEQALEINPKHDQANLRMGQILLEQGKPNEARPFLETARDLAKRPSFRLEAENFLRKIGG